MDIGFISSIERKLRPGKSSGERDTFVATATLLGVDKQIPVYFKAFNRRDTYRGIFNEIVGYHVARACGLPVSQDTFICISKRTKIIGPAKCLQDRKPEDKYIPGIASIDGNPHKTKQLVNDLLMYETELLNWRYLPQVAVYDELMFNNDRTVHNLIRVGRNEFIIIDYESILGGTSQCMDHIDELLKKTLDGKSFSKSCLIG